jgi:hypothetical protein
MTDRVIARESNPILSQKLKNAFAKDGRLKHDAQRCRGSLRCPGLISIYSCHALWRRVISSVYRAGIHPHPRLRHHLRRYSR